MLGNNTKDQDLYNKCNEYAIIFLIAAVASFLPYVGAALLFFHASKIFLESYQAGYQVEEGGWCRRPHLLLSAISRIHLNLLIATIGFLGVFVAFFFSAHSVPIAIIILTVSILFAVLFIVNAIMYYFRMRGINLEEAPVMAKGADVAALKHKYCWGVTLLWAGILSLQFTYFGVAFFPISFILFAIGWAQGAKRTKLFNMNSLFLSLISGLVFAGLVWIFMSTMTLADNMKLDFGNETVKYEEYRES